MCFTVVSCRTGSIKSIILGQQIPFDVHCARSWYRFLLSLICTPHACGMFLSINIRALLLTLPKLSEHQVPLQWLIRFISNDTGQKEQFSVRTETISLHKWLTRPYSLSLPKLLFLFPGTTWSAGPGGSPRCQRFPGQSLTRVIQWTLCLTGHFSATLWQGNCTMVTSDRKKPSSVCQSQPDSSINTVQWEEHKAR